MLRNWQPSQGKSMWGWPGVAGTGLWALGCRTGSLTVALRCSSRCLLLPEQAGSCGRWALNIPLVTLGLLLSPCLFVLVEKVLFQVTVVQLPSFEPHVAQGRYFFPDASWGANFCCFPLCFLRENGLGSHACHTRDATYWWELGTAGSAAHAPWHPPSAATSCWRVGTAGGTAHAQ